MASSVHITPSSKTDHLPSTLLRPITSIKGVGPAIAGKLGQLCRSSRAGLLEPSDIATPCRVKDLLFHLPSSIIDRRKVVSIGEAQDGQIVTLIVDVGDHFTSKRRGQPYRIHVSDASGSMQLVFFHARGDYLTKLMPAREKRVISGRVELFDGVKQMSHPDIIAPPEQLERVARVEPQYPLTAGVSQKQIQKAMGQLLSDTESVSLPEWADQTFTERQQWMPSMQALHAAHHPESLADVEPDALPRQRLAYDELLAHQLAMALMREQHHALPAVKISGQSTLQQQVMDALPFTLTDGQKQVLAEIESDMASGARMMRLLQGDVGSGKTVVCLLAMANAVAQGYQCALMVPTEILGRQHAMSLARMAEAAGMRVGMLNGKLKKSEREQRLQAIASGEMDIVVGTHALFQESVQFKQLGLVVIDEQHRFGVNQRIALSEKGDTPHTLLMTATPIPRTLTMTAYGDMDCSLLTEKPANRKPIDTRAVPLPRIDEVIAGIGRAIEQGEKVYWICPLVEEKEPDMLGHSFAGDLAAAEERYHVFQKIFGPHGMGVGLVHGKMKPADREPVMAGFAGDQFQVLVATTVVEVGVDVPDATIIVIEHAERFGLAQLHQLRGRVGRSDKQSRCILLYSERVSEVARRRLSIMRESNDGFYIAEEDLNLRGAGEVLGTKQSGLPNFHFADLLKHRELMIAARNDVKLALHQDPELKGERGQALRQLLVLFDYDDSVLRRVG